MIFIQNHRGSFSELYLTEWSHPFLKVVTIHEKVALPYEDIAPAVLLSDKLLYSRVSA